MADVFCNNCGHRNPLGSNFCSSCGAVLETQAAENTTITFHPTAPTDPTDEEVSVELDEVPEEIAVLVVKRGPQAGSRFALDSAVTTAGRHPESDIFLDDITVSRRHAEIERRGEGYVVQRRGLAERHVPQPGANRGSSLSRTATRCRSASSSWCSSSVRDTLRNRHG